MLLSLRSWWSFSYIIIVWMMRDQSVSSLKSAYIPISSRLLGIKRSAGFLCWWISAENMMRIAEPEPDLLNIKVLVRRKGRIRIMGNLIGIHMIRVSSRLIRRLQVRKSEVGYGLLFLWDVSNAVSLNIIFLSAQAQLWISSSVGSQVTELLTVGVIIWLTIII